MSRFVLAVCILTFACRTAIAEDKSDVPAEKAKQRQLQVGDIITVSIDRPTNADGAVDKGPDAFTKMAVCVAEIRPDSTLVLEGRSEVVRKNGAWEYSLTGTVRPSAIGPDRVVHTRDIADFRIKVCNKGPIGDSVDGAAIVPAPVCTRHGAPYAPTPVGLISSPNAPKVAELRQKEAELAQLEQEIRQLRTQAQAPQQILVHAQVLEVSLTKMEKLGLEMISMSSGYSTMTSEAASQLIRKLTASNAAKVISEPNIVALDGRSASFQVGGEVPIPGQLGKEAVEFRPIGTQLDILPQSLGDNRVRLELNLRVSDAVEFHGTKLPAFNVRQISLGFESAYGESAVLSGLVDTRHESIKAGGKIVDVENRVGLILVVTPERVEVPQTAQRTGGESAPR